MANLLYHWNFTGSSGSVSLNQAIYDSESSLIARVKRRISGVSGGTYASSNFAVSADGITLDNNDSVNGGYYIDLEGLDIVNLGGTIIIEMVVTNIERNKDTVYFQSIRKFIDTNGDDLDDNLGIVTSGFNSHSAFLKLFFKQGTGTRMQVRTDSQYNSTAKDGRVTYFLKNATSGTAITNDNNFHHYLIIIDKNGANSSKTIQLFIDGSEAGSTTADLQKELSDAVRQFNAIGTQKNPENATYLKGTVKYLKIYQNSMTDSEATTTYNNYNSSPYWSDYSGASDSDKFTRRHDSINTYFTDNSGVTTLTMTGNQLGLLNSAKTYTIYKFTNGSDIDISSGFHYVPIQGQNNYIIFKNGAMWYKITQTSADNGTSTVYQYEISTDGGSSYGAAVTGKTFGESFADGAITIAFGGAESGYNEQAICFHEDTLVTTDQGEVKIKDITSKHSINGKNIIYKIKSPNKPKKIVLIEKGAFGVDLPSRDILITEYHDILINNSFAPIYKYINGKSIRLVDNYSDVYNLILLEEPYVNVSNLDLGVINMSSYYLEIINKYIRDYKEEYIYCSIQANNKDVKTNDVNINVNKFLEFNMV